MATREHLGLVDKWLFLAVIILSVFGLVMVYDSSVAIALRDFGNQYYFVREQARWLLFGLLSLIFFSRFDYRHWRNLALPFLLITLLLLVLVWVPGIGIGALGARRWLNLGFFVLQPAEVAKLAIVVYLSAWLSTNERGRLAAFLLLIVMVAGLVVVQPDLGTASIILISSLGLYFLSGAPLRHFFLLLPMFLGGIGGLAVISPYRLKRLLTFLNPEHDPLGASYQVRQALLAFGSGGWLGVGLGKSRQKYEYLPEANTDSIFAIIGEEMGFIGAALVVVLFLFVIWRGFRIARRCPEKFGRLLAGGISTFIGVQAVINLAAMVALVPLTGIPLPLVSYGGSSLVVMLTALGILLNISRHR